MPPTILTPRSSATPRKHLIGFDPGWLFLIAGLVVIGVTIILPAKHDLDLALWQRDRSLAIEKHRLDRLERYATFLKAIQTSDEATVLSLTAIQLNKSPIDRVPLDPAMNQRPQNASVFPALEPPLPIMPAKPIITEKSSALARWSTDDHSRLWMFAGGLLCALLGLLPASSRAESPEAQSV